MSEILKPGFGDIVDPYVVVCEGSGDARFVFELLKTRRIANCTIGYPNEKDSGGGGKDAIGKYLSSLSAWYLLHPERTLQGVLILLDADDSPESAFELACKALQEAGFHTPGKACSRESGLWAANGTPVAVAVSLIPGLQSSGEQEKGTLEDILLRATFEKNPQFEKCLDAFICCIGRAPEEKPNKKAKMRMSALVGASFPTNPWASLDSLLASSKNDLVPIDSIHFKNLADFLAEFCTE